MKNTHVNCLRAVDSDQLRVTRRCLEELNNEFLQHGVDLAEIRTDGVLAEALLKYHRMRVARRYAGSR